jgi:nitrite reductase/ring-hydroxylating ferredoxin subunit
MSHPWIPIARSEDVAEGGTLQTFCGDEVVCVYRLEGRLYATQDECTHGQASLAEGYVDGDKIECPFHQGLFHIPSGKAVGAPCTVDLRTYEVKEESGEVLLKDPAG